MKRKTDNLFIPNRRAATTVEFLTAGALLSVAMTFLLPFVGRVIGEPGNC